MGSGWPRRQFLGTAATLALVTAASARAWLDRFTRPRLSIVAAAAPPSLPTPEPSPVPIPIPVPAEAIAVIPLPIVAPAPIAFGISVAVSSALAPLIGIDAAALAGQLVAALATVPDATFTVGTSRPAVNLTLRTVPAGWQSVPLRRVPLVPVVSPRLASPMLPADQLAALLDGKTPRWSALGASTDPPVELLVLAPLAGVGDARLVAPPGRTFATVDELVGALLGRAGGIAFLPLPALTPRLMPLPIGEMDAASGHGPLDAYPLALSLVAAIAPDAPVGTLDAVRAWAQTLPPAPPSYNVLMLGDIIQGRTVHKQMEAARDWQLPFRKVAPFTAAADLTLADNECDYSDTLANPADRDPMTFAFLTKTAAVSGLTLAGIDGVTLANNHSMNMGRQGLLDTIAALDARGIAHTGAGADLATARQPALFTVKGIKIALLGYNGVSAGADGATAHTAGTMPLDLDLLTEDMVYAKTKAAVVIPFFHWGVEYTSAPTKEQVRFAHAAIDLGAAVVIGSHPHWVQATEVYKGVPILYSLGNYVFDQEWSAETKQGVMADLQFVGNRLVGVRLVPIVIADYSTPHLATAAEAAPILARIWDATDTLAKS